MAVKNKGDMNMPFPGAILESNPYLMDDSVLAGYRGSIAHGMYVPSKGEASIADDKDVMCVIIPPIDCYFGLSEFGRQGTKEIVWGEWDIVSYELRKFIWLLVKGNPNVLALLWLSPNYYIKKTNEGTALIENRKLFSTKTVYHSFTGYAHDQLHRMTHQKFQGYMGEKRKQLVEKFGYDCKNAAHLIRLLRMGIEFLNEGELHVLREDASQLLEIKKGEWDLERVKKEADHLFKRAEEVYSISKLPDRPDLEKISRLTEDLFISHFGKQSKS